MTPSQSPNARLKPIENFWDALIMRKIRNEARLFMTNDTSSISIFRQLKWYFKTLKPQQTKGDMLGFLFESDGQDVGFGLISVKEGKYFLTGAIKESQREQGLGKKLFAQLVKSVPSSVVWLEVLDSNTVARKLYEALGFKKTSHKEVAGRKVSIMKLVK